MVPYDFSIFPIEYKEDKMVYYFRLDKNKNVKNIFIPIKGYHYYTQSFLDGLESLR
ncbi:MAG: hypothetical protein AB7S48_02510 [Bacteroidales bacterium]